MIFLRIGFMLRIYYKMYVSYDTIRQTAIQTLRSTSRFSIISRCRIVFYNNRKVMFLCVKKCACGQVLVSVRDCFLDKLPKHITPQHTYFHMPLPQNVLFVYSTSFPLLKYSPIFAVNLSAIFAWSDHILRNTSSGCLVWYFTSTKLKYSTTSPSLTF